MSSKNAGKVRPLSSLNSETASTSDSSYRMELDHWSQHADPSSVFAAPQTSLVIICGTQVLPILGKVLPSANLFESKKGWFTVILKPAPNIEDLASKVKKS